MKTKMKIIIGLLGVTLSLNAGEVYATFSVNAEKNAMLAFDAGGIVKEVNYDIASSVKEGSTLASLSNADIKATLESAKTALKYAQKDYERQLKVKELIDEGRFDQFALKYESAKNQVAYAQAKYDKTFLKAPFDGVIYDKEIEVGDTVSGMMLKTVFKIQSAKKRKLVLSFDQKYHKRVKIGQTFRYKVDGDDREYTGHISKLYPFANSANRKMQAEVKAEGFIVGLFGEGYIVVPETK